MDLLFDNKPESVGLGNPHKYRLYNGMWMTNRSFPWMFSPDVYMDNRHFNVADRTYVRPSSFRLGYYKDE